MYEKARTDLLFVNVNVYFPSKSVMAPFDVPTSNTETPIKGSPVTSFTTPLTVCPTCAYMLPMEQSMATTTNITSRQYFKCIFLILKEVI